MVNIDLNQEIVLAENVDFDTYLREYEGQNVELLDGKVIKMSPVTDKHDELTLFLAALFNIYLTLTGEGKMRHDKFTMRIGERRAPEPDLLVVTTANLAKLKPTYVDGAADLVIEVVSLESMDRDRGRKFKDYESAGVKEYWIVDSINQDTAFYVLGEDQRFHLVAPDENGYYRSTVLPRLYFEVAVLHQQPIPNVLAAVALVEKMLAEKSE